MRAPRPEVRGGQEGLGCPEGRTKWEDTLVLWVERGALHGAPWQLARSQQRRSGGELAGIHPSLPSAPARLAVGFGPKEKSPTLAPR